MRIIEAEHNAGLYDNPPALMREDILRKYRDWADGKAVLSGVNLIGSIGLTFREQSFLDGIRILGTGYSMLSDAEILQFGLGGLQQAFLALVGSHVAVSGLSGAKITSKIFAGHYHGEDDAEPWHSDDHKDPSIRYTVSFGVGSTRHAQGYVSRTDIETDNVNGGDLLPHVTVAPGGQLEEVEEIPCGTVAQFVNVADIHASPWGDGARILLQATVRL